MKIQHQKLASGAWQKLTLAEQMTNIGSEVIRGNIWRKKRPDFSQTADDRALELLFLTIEDTKNRSKLRELTRLYEIMAGNIINNKVDKKLENYFLAFNYAAQCRR